ncbi:MAG: hypothetical protein KTR14_07915 [Vampirovibrio sp.]|nr:hypothetical protein [Vampirovibrio sp.]
MQSPTVVIDVGSQAIKTLGVKADGTKLSLKNYLVENGQSLARANGIIDSQAFTVLTNQLQKIRQSLENKGIHWNQLRQTGRLTIVGTAWLRGAKNEKTIINKLNDLDFPIQPLSSKNEAQLVYPGVFINEKIAPDEKILVIEIGGGSIELVGGDGPQHIDLENATKILEVGATSIPLPTPFNHQDVVHTRQAYGRLFQKQLSQFPMPTWTKNRRTFMRVSSLKHLQPTHQKKFQKDLFRSEFTLQEIESYLSPKGLAFLKEEIITNAAPGAYLSVVTKLIILAELLKALNIPAIELGSNAGMKYGLITHQLKSMAAQ